MPEKLNVEAEVLPNALIGMAGVFWVASELSRRGWVSMPTVRNQKGVDIIATSSNREGESRFVEIQVKATQKAGARFWMLGAQNREDIPNRASLFFVFVRPESKEPFARFEAFVVPSSKVSAEAQQQENKKWPFSWYPKDDAYKGSWNCISTGNTIDAGTF